MTEDEMDCLADKIADAITAKNTTNATHIHVNLSGQHNGSKADLAASVTAAIRDAVRKGQLPKNALTAL